MLGGVSGCWRQVSVHLPHLGINALILSSCVRGRVAYGLGHGRRSHWNKTTQIGTWILSIAITHLVSGLKLWFLMSHHRKICAPVRGGKRAGHNFWKNNTAQGKIEGRRGRGRQRMRWLDDTTDSMDLSLDKLRELVDGQGGLACCSPWGRKELDKTERLNWTELNWRVTICKLRVNYMFVFLYSSPFTVV